jgi:acetylornithine deacetylase/succinyl-diaminopimelate desuccinylase-like protein
MTQPCYLLWITSTVGDLDRATAEQAEAACRRHVRPGGSVVIHRKFWPRFAAPLVVTGLLVGACTGGSGDTNGANQAATPPGQASQEPGQGYAVTTQISRAYDTIKSLSSAREGLDFIQRDHQRTIDEQIAITEIPAPPFQEDQRGADYLRRLTELGLENVRRDSVGNVYGLRRGTGNGPTLFISAHMDTVFPPETDVSVTQQDGKLYGPGIGDDGRGLAALLSVVRAFQQTAIQTQGDIIFGGTVGEEGLGDLRGVKAFFAENKDVDGFITIEPGNAEDVTYQATGSRRYKISFPGPGGHSFGDFGRPSSINAMGRAIAAISEIRTPEDPKTTFTVGVVEGGTSVNSIAGDAAMQVDMRSNDPGALKMLEEQLLPMAQSAADAENARWNAPGDGKITVKTELIGDRPAGDQDPHSPIVETSYAASAALGLPADLGDPSSTDANLPISLGIPAVRLGGGGHADNTHSFTDEEWFDPKDAQLGPQRIFLTALGLVGVAGPEPVNPLLPSR